MSLDFNLTVGETWTVILGQPVSEIAGTVLSIDMIFLFFVMAAFLSFYPMVDGEENGG